MTKIEQATKGQGKFDALPLWGQFASGSPHMGLPPAMRTKEMRKCPSWKAHWGWERIIRNDICAYCGGPGGTVDHIEPFGWRKQRKQRKKRSVTEAWLNKTGACVECNTSKSGRSLLLFLLDEQDYLLL